MPHVYFGWFVNVSNFKIPMPPVAQHEFKHRVKP